MKSLLKFNLVFLLLVSGQVLAASSPSLQIRNGYVRGLPPGVSNTAVYMTLVNNSDEDVVLTGASTSASSSASLHSTVRRNGQMTMEPVMSAVIPARDHLELKSGGMHLMLMGLKKPLKSGDTVRLTLQFEGGFVNAIQLPVVSVLDE